MDDSEQQRTRLSEIEHELARLQYRHDIAMSAFRFEEATALGRIIAALDTERQALAASTSAGCRAAVGRRAGAGTAATGATP